MTNHQTIPSGLGKRGIIAWSLAMAILSGCAPRQTKPAELPVSTVSHGEESLANRGDEVKWNPRIEAPGLEEPEFTDICASAVRSVLDRATVTVSNPLELKVSDRNSRSEKVEFIMLLENAWKTCKDAPGERRKRLRPYFRNLTEHGTMPENSTQSIVDRVIPLVRTKAYFGTKEQVEVVSEPLGADLLIVYGVDSHESFGYLTPEARGKIKLDSDKLRAKALENLDKILSKREIEVEERNGMLRITCGGDFESSLILDAKFMKAIRQRIGSSQIFGIPARHQLFMTNEATPDGVDLLRKMTTIGFKECDHAISDKLYRFADGKVTFIE